MNIGVIDILISTIECGLCSIFFFAGLEKVWDRERFFILLLQVPYMPIQLSKLLVYAIPLGEVIFSVIAACFGGYWALVPLAILNLSFTVGLFLLLIYKKKVACGCFGDLSKKPISLGNVVFNIVMFVLLCGVFITHLNRTVIFNQSVIALLALGTSALIISILRLKLYKLQ